MDHVQLIKRHLADYSGGRWNEYRASLAEDVTYDEVATRTRAKGIDDYIAVVKRWKRAFPDLAADVRDVFVADDKLMAEIEWSGTHTGPFEGPFGTIAPTNQHGVVKAVLMYRFARGKIVETRHYFDVLTVLTELGAIPNLVAPMPPPKPVAASDHAW